MSDFVSTCVSLGAAYYSARRHSLPSTSFQNVGCCLAEGPATGHDDRLGDRAAKPHSFPHQERPLKEPQTDTYPAWDVTEMIAAAFFTHTTLHIAPSIVALLGAGVLILISGLPFRLSGQRRVGHPTAVSSRDCVSWWARWSRRASSAICRTAGNATGRQCAVAPAMSTRGSWCGLRAAAPQCRPG